MNNKKGFTLIELLAVIAILGVILTITIPVVTNVISDSKNNLHNQQIQQLEKAARTWYLYSSQDLEDGESCKISIDYLIDNGYIESSKVIDPKTGETMEGYFEIKGFDNKEPDYAYKETSTLSTCK